MVLREGTQSCILMDLSLSGARVETSQPARLGDEAVLMWGGFESFGQVVWTTPSLCGVALFDPISDATLLGTRQLDQVARLPDDRELTRNSARSYVEGRVRL